MSLVATIAVDPDRNPIDEALIARVRAALPIADIVHLAPRRAVDLVLSGDGDRGTATNRLRAALGPDAAADFLVQPADGRRKALLISDMDSTLIGQECIDELADAAGLKDHVAAITERAMAGEIAFEPALRERVRLLAGVPAATVTALLAETITLTPGASTLVATMRAHGAHTALVSGGFTVFTDTIVERLGMDEGHANRLVVADGAFTGEVIEPVLGAAAKRERLDTLVATLGVSHRDVVAIGDGANDLAMIEAAGLGIAYRAKPAVAAAARAEIRHTDLSTALFFQGFSIDAFVG